MIDVKNTIAMYDDVFSKIVTIHNVAKLSYEESAVFIDSLIPRHADITMSSFDDVDGMLQLYPYLYQKVSLLHYSLINAVRKLIESNHDKNALGAARAQRDIFEQLLRVIKLQYESLEKRMYNLRSTR